MINHCIPLGSSLGRVHPKIWLKMKLAALLLLLNFTTIFANQVYSQKAKVTINTQGSRLEEIFNKIESQTHYLFFYNKKEVDVNKLVAFKVSNTSVDEVMTKLFDGSGIRHNVVEDYIILSKNESGFKGISTAVQQHKITGVIKDATDGEPLVGAQILVEGTKTATITDLSGSFAIEVPSDDANLVVSFIGYVTAKVSTAGKQNIELKLARNVQNLEEVVVVGYGTQKKTNLTGSVAVVGEKELDSRPVTNVAQALQGMAPGLNISQNGGSMENTPAINIRGITTIGKGSSGNPLILIDGMEGDLNMVNPNDVENISVLKDAAASSIYGSRAPFGVILVTTKKGKVGKMQVSYNGNMRSTEPIVLPKQMDSYSFVQYINTAHRNGGWGDFFSPDRVQRVKDFMDGKLGNKTIIPDPNKPQYWADGYSYGNDNVDWYRAIYRTSAPSQEHSLTINGGTERLSYYLSGDFLTQDGLMKLSKDNYKRYSFSAKVDAKVTNWLTIMYTGRFTRAAYYRPSALGGGLFSNLARQGWPVLPLYDPNGNLYSSPSPALALRDGGQDKKEDDTNYQQLNVTLEPLKGWRIFANFNYKIQDIFRHWDILPTYNHDVAGNAYYAPQTWYLPGTSQVHEQAERTNYISPNIYTEYSKSLGLHNVKLMVGYQSELNKYRNLGVTRQGVLVPSSPVVDIAAGTDDQGKIVAPSVYGQYSEWSTSGAFGRINYDYDGRYLIEANLRYDGTSRFRSDKRWNFFPSASLGWNVAREAFWKPIEIYVNTFKFRASYGDLGNQNMDSWYPTYVTMPFQAAGGSWLINGVKPNKSWAPGLISSTLSWERVRTWNGGLDLGLFNGRLSASFDYFVRYTDDMVGPAPELPVILGTGVPTTNNTNLKTSGFELALSWKDRLKNGLGYSVGFTLADSRTKITAYPNPTGKLDTYYDGQMYGEIWGYTTVGIAKTQAEMDAHLASLPKGAQNAMGNNWKAGDIMYKDVNGDGKVDGGANTLTDHGDLSVIGNKTPRYLTGLDLSADWKGFDFRAFFQGVLKRDYFQGSSYFFGASGGGLWDAVAFKEHSDYFRDDPNSYGGLNLDSYYPRPLFNNKNIQTQSRYLLDASYIRLKNLQIGYTVPSFLSQKIKIQKCRIYVSGENIWTKTKLPTMFDPETIDGGDNSNGNAYPLSKVYSIGLSVTF